MLLAHVSDTHLLADPTAELWGHNTTVNLAAVMEAMPAQVDVLVISGDIAEEGSPDSYDRALSLTANRARKRYFLAGNHDDPAAMRAAFGEVPALEMVPLSRHWTLGLLNSQWLGHDEGRIGDEVLSLVREALDRSDNHVVLCLHHPPVSPCAKAQCGLSDGAALCEAVHDGPVRLVLSGHVHQAFDVTVDGVRYLGAPSTFRQLRHGADPHYTDTGEPPAARLVELDDNGTVTSQIVIAA